EGAARFFAGRALRVVGRQGRRETVPDYAGEGNFHSWSRPCPSQNNRARKPGRITGENDRGARGRIKRARVEGFAGTETGIRAGRNSADAVGLTRERIWRFPRRILLRSSRIERPQNHRALFHFSRTREAECGRRARNTFQRADSLGGAAGPGD